MILQDGSRITGVFRDVLGFVDVPESHEVKVLEQRGVNRGHIPYRLAVFAKKFLRTADEKFPIERKDRLMGQEDIRLFGVDVHSAKHFFDGLRSSFGGGFKSFIHVQ